MNAVKMARKIFIIFTNAIYLFSYTMPYFFSKRCPDKYPACNDTYR